MILKGSGLLHLTATGFRRQLDSGRTRPCIFACEREGGEPDGEFVVKLRSRLDLGDRSATNELIASLLAIELGLNVPEPAVVEIDPMLAEGVVELDVRADVRHSVGLNFGSRLLGNGWRTWQSNEILHKRYAQTGFEIFTFDALIDNPDRTGRDGRPSNLMTDGSLIVMLDHELAFSFLQAIFPPAEPWTLNSSTFLQQHIFYGELRRVLVVADRIREALAELTPATLDQIEETVPASWRGQHVLSIRNHVEAIMNHTDDFIAAVKQILR